MTSQAAFGPPFFRMVPVRSFRSCSGDAAPLLHASLRYVDLAGEPRAVQPVALSVPALVTLVVVNALWVWNELLIALVFLPEDRLKTLMVGVTVFQNRYNLDVPVTMAGMLLASLPMILLYLFGQRFFIRGLTAGAVKG